ncbi:lipopolysaccharide assembly protein LapA domain-containing protein [Hydrogenophaga sp. RWCD_12]|uniref:lipopolysaccharide assembly protein LapA domain-containing protein n=1 Tax=Hydrogenophaga sp. RWCD_12 TaxID=3391190 RepID=UPI003984A799
MKYLMWLLNAAIFFVLFAFALNNQDAVTLHLFFGARWQAPLVLILLCALLLGVVLGVVVMLPLWLRARRSRRIAVAPAPIAPVAPQVPDAVAVPPQSLPHGS